MLAREREPPPVALEHLAPREQVVADGDRLCPLEVRVAGHRGRRILLGTVEDDVDEIPERGRGLVASVHDVEPERGGDLVVARAPRMDLPAHLAEPPLDRRVGVLVGRVRRVDRRETVHYLREFVVRQETGRAKALGVDPRRLDVVRKELCVVRPQELPHLRREAVGHAAVPESHSGQPSAASIRRVSSMSFTCTESWPIRSPAVKAVSLRSIDNRSGWYVTASPAVSRMV